ncbi:flagellin [Sporosarcina sp. P7]|uniref:flagellin N-terminal helical domain-containing protein n=1 Tax=Sporosarcina sp. P7 TaxID=2048244 RepID=UPI000C169F53|nr:flagellin [Sporosarcina sp. P7]PID23932.1 flagellin [Sporosarcina sp. P7]
MIINHNMAAMNTHRQLGSNNAAAANNIEKLSSGLKINRAGDDAAGLAISEKMRGQIRGLDMAAKNSQDGISLIQTAEGSLNETHDILQRMRELAVQAGNDTNTESDRGEIQKELNSLTSEINRIGNTTEFNTQKLLNGTKDGAGSAAVTAVQGEFEIGVTSLSAGVTIDGKAVAGSGSMTLSGLATAINGTSGLSGAYTASVASGKLILTQNSGSESASAPVINAGGSVTTNTAGVVAKAAVVADDSKTLKLQIGANQDQSLSLDIADMRASALGLTTAGSGDKLAVTDGTSNATSEQALDVSTHAQAAQAVTIIQDAIDKVSAERSKLGANQNRLEHTINNLGTSSENLTAAESRIRDVDYVLAA